MQDQLGSTRGLLDASGNVVGTFTYGAYGTLTGHTEAASTPFGYAGQYTDSESGLCKAGPLDLPVGGAGYCSDSLRGTIIQHLPHHRLPDYITVQFQAPLGKLMGLPFLGIQLGGTYDRYGNVYVDFGGAIGYPAAQGYSVNAGYINSPCTSEAQTKNNIGSLSLTAGAYNYVGSQVVWGLPGQFNARAVGYEFGAGKAFRLTYSPHMDVSIL